MELRTLQLGSFHKPLGRLVELVSLIYVVPVGPTMIFEAVNPTDEILRLKFPEADAG